MPQLGFEQIRVAFTTHQDEIAPCVYDLMMNLIDLASEKNQTESLIHFVWFLQTYLGGMHSVNTMKIAFCEKMTPFGEEYQTRFDEMIQAVYHRQEQEENDEMMG